MRINDVYNSNITVFDSQAADNSGILQGEQLSETETQTGNIIEDTLEISDDGKKKSMSIKEELAKIESDRAEWKRQLEAAREQGEAVGESMMIKIRCLRISLQIIKGDKVPVKDYQYLIKNDPELYSKAVSMRMENENPKKRKRISEDEEEAANETEEAASTEIEQTESVEATTEISVETQVSSEAE